LSLGFENIVLLGGPEDTERNFQIGKDFEISQSPTRLGLKDGHVSVQACDLIVTGDSLGMHMAIARKKYVVAWFGPTCAHEIDLYDRGVALIAKVECSPCWKKSCDKINMCYDQIKIEEVIAAIHKGVLWHQENQISLFKPHILEICS
jgi:heptosyltransferase-2